MNEETTGAVRQIDADEVNRMAQELNRQVYTDLPEYAGENAQADPDRTAERVPAADRESPLLDMERDNWPPPPERATEIGGSVEDRKALADEERR